MRIAIVGSGISGISCARVLLKHCASVDIFEKSAIAGGRVATELCGEAFFDNGAQYFTVSSPKFKECVEQWLNVGVSTLWTGKIGKIVSGELLAEDNTHERFVGVPHMRAIAEHLAKDLNITFDSEVKGVRQVGRKWVVQFENGGEASDFDAVIIGTPPPQAVPILRGFRELEEQCASVSMNPCWSTMVSFESRLSLEFDGIFGEKASALSWMCRDSSKPQRATGERFVLHATPDWTRQHLNDDANFVSALLLQTFFEITKTPTIESDFSQSYLWLNAAPSELKTFAGFADASGTLIVCGDWCHSGKVEGAFLSGIETAERLLLI